MHNAVRKLSLERSKKNGPTEFHPITEKGWHSLQCVRFSDSCLWLISELESKEGHLQVEEFRVSLKPVIFCSL